MRRVFAGLVVALVGLFGALALAEGVLRIFSLAPTESLVTVNASEFETLPGMFSPTPRFLDLRNPALPHHARVNDLGFRGEDFPLAKPAGEFRILHVGDSFVWGDFVDDEAALPAQIELALRRQCGPVRVINAGLPGSTITEQREVVSRGRAASPDLVLLSFTENDVTDLGRPTMWEQLAVNRAAKSRPPLGLVYPVLRRTALWNLALTVRAKQRTMARAKEAGPAIAPPDGKTTADTARRRWYADEFTTLATTLQRDGIPFVATQFPAHHTLYGRWAPEQLRWFEGVAQRAGVPVVATDSALAKDGRDERTLYLLPHDGHPSAAGYAVAAGVIAQTLQQHPALAARCRPAAPAAVAP